jgi:Acyl-CoA dehydrogenase, C-terminal domain
VGHAAATAHGRPPVTNIRNTLSPHWRSWLKPENRCLVPANSFAEYAPEPNPERPDDALKIVARGRFAVGSQMGAYEHALRCATERLQFGKPIGGFQLVQDLLVRMLGNVTATQSMLLPGWVRSCAVPGTATRARRAMQHDRLSGVRRQNNCTVTVIPGLGNTARTFAKDARLCEPNSVPRFGDFRDYVDGCTTIDHESSRSWCRVNPNERSVSRSIGQAASR